MSRASFGQMPFIDDLQDVDTSTTTPSTGDHLEWDGTTWIPAAPSGGGGTDPIIEFDFALTQGDNKWGDSGRDFNSDDTPHILPFPGELIAMTYTNEENDSDCKVQLFKNGNSNSDKIVDWQFTNTQTRYKTDFSSITFAQGDVLSLKVKKNGSDKGKNIVVKAYVKVTSQPSGEAAGNG